VTLTGLSCFSIDGILTWSSFFASFDCWIMRLLTFVSAFIFCDVSVIWT